jgi:hypothetical protein
VLAKRVVASDTPNSPISLFSPDFPASTGVQSELKALRNRGRLLPENDRLIRRTVRLSGDYLDMPPALLWCLLFQESRLDHLVGLESQKGAIGLGQFSYFSFYEINHHLTNYGKDNFHLMRDILGGDIRPVEANVRKLSAVSSYFYIPTAVVSSASFLNNRYLQLKRILERKKLTYDPDMLWLYAAMAYNKGTRSVLSFWNQALQEGGPKEVSKLLRERRALFETLANSRRLTHSLRRIWPAREAASYAKELSIHMKNLGDCALGSTSPKYGESEVRGRF